MATAPRTSALLVVIVLTLLVNLACGEATDTTQNTTSVVPIYGPGYGKDSWSALRGSVIGSNSAETTYTLFCAEQPSPLCKMSAEYPMTVIEGPRTVRHLGQAEDVITVQLDCKLESTTAATCTGSTAFGKSYTRGRVTGPTSTSWTSTMTMTAVQWGELTLATPPSAEHQTGGSFATQSLPNETVNSTPSATKSGASRLAIRGSCTAFVMAAVGAALTSGFIMA